MTTEKKRKNSRQKGKVGERAAAEFLRSIGFTSARRGAQHRGGPESPDVIVDELPSIHFEVKRGEAVQLGTAALYAALKQASDDSATCEGVVLWRPNNCAWRLTFYPTGDAPMLALTVAGAEDIRHALLWLQRQLEIKKSA